MTPTYCYVNGDVVVSFNGLSNTGEGHANDPQVIFCLVSTWNDRLDFIQSICNDCLCWQSL